MVAARNDPALEAFPPPPRTRRALAFAIAIARIAVTDWEGVGDTDGNPLPVTSEGIDALLEVWPIFEAFQAGFFRRISTTHPENSFLESGRAIQS